MSLTKQRRSLNTVANLYVSIRGTTELRELRGVSPYQLSLGLVVAQELTSLVEGL